MLRRELYNNIIRLAEPIYGHSEAKQIGRMLFEELLGVSRMELLTSPDEAVSLCDEECQRIIEEVGEGRPVQYIIGEAEFCDMRFTVREGVLIPRPESEELIRWITEDESNERGEILDIGTGSGALAIALSRSLPHHQTTAIEISDKAIEIARENIERLSPNRVTIIKGDALRGVENFTPEGKRYDVIVSNPPYIPQNEEAEMRINVTRYEPHLALFVPDDDPLLFYRTIARSAKQLLKKEGKLYFEIHENFATQTKEMLRGEGYKKVEIRLDINDKARMICAQRE